MRVLVTGAAGKLGGATVRALVRAGFEVSATDQRFNGELGVPFRVADLREEHALYPLLEGMDALVHLGNHPNRFAGPSPQRILAENTAMNANAFTAALDLGVKHVVFASSIQVMITNDRVPTEPHTLPYLPLDGDAPHDPGLNAYALSKQFGEEFLRTAATVRPDLAATSVRYPMLVGDWFEKRLSADGGRVRRDVLHLGEATAHLSLEAAGALVVPLLARGLPGYRQILPAQTIDVTNLPPPELIRRFYPGVRCKKSLESIDRLIDITDVEKTFGWQPSERPRVVLVEP
jgi:nucleoside-diphosphate-sugar epimerase